MSAAAFVISRSQAAPGRSARDVNYFGSDLPEIREEKFLVATLDEERSQVVRQQAIGGG
jgi:hypothetical protein